MALFLNAYAQDQAPTEPGDSTSSTSDSGLPRNVFVPPKVVKEFFPDITGHYSTDADSNAVGKPTATEMATYGTRDGSRRVILSVDDYASPGDALSAYQVAVQKSQVPEFNPIALANVGQQVLAGIVTRGSETRVVIRVLDGSLIVGATLAGYEATTDNIAKLTELARQEVSQARSHVRSRRRR
ncbi:MAG TPA: hypothetical protein VL240_10310 [Candidatus Binatia bacterium]|nr:hypothetical protein [Candidatus Binatia bacterium]